MSRDESRRCGVWDAPVEVGLVDTRAANLSSIRAALERAGARVVWVRTAGEVRAANALVLPGVGAFGAVAELLAERGLDLALAERLHAGRATLAICLGMQLLAAGSDESPSRRGLGLWPERVGAFSAGLRRPHLGWAPIEPEPGCSLLEPGWAAFAHGYRCTRVPAGWRAAWCREPEPFVAALERGALLACQFHPELSGPFGARLIRRWLRAAARVAATQGVEP